MNKVVISDKNDSPVGLRAYSELTYEDIYQVTAAWITDTKTAEVLTTQRKWSKHNDPGKWMAAASGTVEEGESYDENIVKEIEEEIGLTGLNLTKGPKEFIDDGKHRFFVQWYLAEVDKTKVTIQLQKEEVEAYAWVPIKHVVKEVFENKDKFVPSMLENLKTLGLV